MNGTVRDLSLPVAIPEMADAAQADELKRCDFRYAFLHRIVDVLLALNPFSVAFWAYFSHI